MLWDINASCNPRQRLPCNLLLQYLSTVPSYASRVMKCIPKTAHSRNQIQVSSSMQGLTSLGIKDLGITLSSKRKETERRISFKHEAVKQVEATALSLFHSKELASQGSDLG
jgi:hypothetical protein